MKEYWIGVFSCYIVCLIGTGIYELIKKMLKKGEK